MEKNKNTIKTKRDLIREKLKGSLTVCKMTLAVPESPQEAIEGKTPEPGIMETQFQNSFQIGDKIGEGASGAVYICHSLQKRKAYAVKVSRGDEEMLRICKRTFKILKNLNHPNIIKAKCLYLDQVSQKTHFVMEYCNYPALSDIQQTLSYSEKKSIITKLLDTINYMHSKGVCHRDLKLENVLYDRANDKVQLIDFGICKKLFHRLSNRQKMWTATGTLHYMAPEMLSGSDYDQSVDYWALGVLTYKLFYSKFPFESEYKCEMIEKIRSEEPVYDTMDILLADFMKRLLKKDPMQRLKGAQGLKHPWIETSHTKKIRLGSDADDIENTNLEIRMRNLSEIYVDSPQLKPSKEEKIESLKQVKQINIFEMKKVPQILRLQIL